MTRARCVQCQFPRLIFYVSRAPSRVVFFFVVVFSLVFVCFCVSPVYSIWSFRVRLNKRHDLRFVLLSLLFVLCTINNLRTTSRMETSEHTFSRERETHTATEEDEASWSIEWITLDFLSTVISWPGQNWYYLSFAKEVEIGERCCSPRFWVTLLRKSNDSRLWFLNVSL